MKVSLWQIGGDIWHELGMYKLGTMRKRSVKKKQELGCHS